MFDTDHSLSLSFFLHLFPSKELSPFLTPCMYYPATYYIAVSKTRPDWINFSNRIRQIETSFSFKKTMAVAINKKLLGFWSF